MSGTRFVAQQTAQHVVVQRRHEGGEADRVERVDLGQRAAQVLVELPLVAEHGDDLALAQGGHLPHDLIAQPRDLRIVREVLEDALGCLAHGDPRVGVTAFEPFPQLVEQHLVVGEDDVFLAAELAEERAARHPRGLRDLLHRGRVEPLPREKVECSGDDGGARG